MYTEEKRYSILAKQLRNYDYVIIDTCSLMDESFPEWMDVFEKAKKEYVDEFADDFHAYVPYRCYEELKKHAKIKSTNPELIDKQIAAKRALRIVRWAKFRRIIEITKKDKDENYADNAITVKVIHDRLDKRILVITQDKGLASDLLYWNHSRSQKGKYIAVYRVVPNGELAPNRGKIDSPREQTTVSKPIKEKPAAYKTQQTKPTTPSSKKEDYDVVSNDKRLKALLTNPNYPLEKKKKDVQKHLEHLSVLSKEKANALALLCNEQGLRQFLSTGVYSDKPAAPEPKASTLPKYMPLEYYTKKLRYGEASSLKEAFSQSASYYDVMFRYDSIPYLPQFHGPVDLTEGDLNEFVALADKHLEGNTLIRVEYKKVIAYVLPKNMSFRVWLDFSEAMQPSKKDETKPSKPIKEEAKIENKPAEPVQNVSDLTPVKLDDSPKTKPSKEVSKKPAKKKKIDADNKVEPAKKEDVAPKEVQPTPVEPKPLEAQKAVKKKSQKQKAAKPVSDPSLTKVEDKAEEKKEHAETPSPEKNQKKKKKAASPKPAEAKPVEQPKPVEKKEKPAAEAKPALAKEKPVTDKKPTGKSKASQSKAPKQKQDDKPKPEPSVEKATKKADSKPKKAKDNKPAGNSKKEPEPKAEPKKQSPKPKKENAPSKPKIEPKKEATPANKPSKKDDKNKKKPANKPSLFEEAKNADVRLKANVNNPNYPASSKLADLKAQLERLKKLKVEERKELSLSIDTIKMLINTLGHAK